MIQSSLRLVWVMVPRRKLGQAVSKTGTALIVLVMCAAGATSCASNAAVQPPSNSVLTVQPAVYATVPAVVSVPATYDQNTIPGEQQYVVIAGDYLYLIADQYCTPAIDLASYNGWPNGISHNLFPGAIVKIPVGACTPN